MVDISALHKEDRDKVVQDYIRELLDWKLGYQGLAVCNLHTGAGKTTGFVKAISELNRQYDLWFLVAVNTMADAETMYQMLNDLNPGDVAVWTSEHDPKSNSERAFKATKSEAGKFPILVITHNNYKLSDDTAWMGDRDIVIIDENPGPVRVTSLTTGEFEHAYKREKAAGSPSTQWFLDVKNWIEQQDSPQHLSTIPLPSHLTRMLPFVITHTDEGRAVRDFFYSLSKGWCFRKKSDLVEWVAYDYQLPNPDKCLIFSATSDLEAWIVEGDMPRLSFEVDYSKMRAKFLPWPDGLDQYIAQHIHKSSVLTNLIDSLRPLMPFPEDQTGTFVVGQKKVIEALEDSGAFPDARMTWYGRDVGSNAFRDCKRCIVINEFWKTHAVYAGNALGKKQVQATDEALKEVRTSSHKAIRDERTSDQASNLKQMIARTNCRNIGDHCIAGEVDIFFMGGVDSYHRLAELFPGCQLEPLPRQVMSRQGGSRDRMALLKDKATQGDRVFVIKDVAGSFDGKFRKQVEAEIDYFSGQGYVYCPGGRGRGKAARFERAF